VTSTHGFVLPKTLAAAGEMSSQPIGYNVSRRSRFAMSHTTTFQKILLLILLVLLGASQAGSVSAGINVWTSNGPEGGSITALEIDPATPATIYAGTHDGIFKSTNGGGNWSAANTGLTKAGVRALAIDPATPTTLYAGTWGCGVFKSTNGSGSWSAVNTGLIATGIYDLAIDPTTPTTLYAGAFDGGVFKSTNGGANWSEFNDGLTSTRVYALAINPTTPATLYAGTFGGGVFAIQMVTAPANVTISGPTTGMSNHTYAFTASVGPLTTTTPITYVWEATGQSPVTTTAHLTSTVTFNWSTSGEKVISVTAENAGGTSRETHIIAIGAQYQIYLPLVLRQSTERM